jgi:hypothetical protein
VDAVDEPVSVLFNVSTGLWMVCGQVGPGMGADVEDGGLFAMVPARRHGYPKVVHNMFTRQCCDW